jgi:hypothetical protein
MGSGVLSEATDQAKNRNRRCMHLEIRKFEKKNSLLASQEGTQS